MTRRDDGFRCAGSGSLQTSLAARLAPAPAQSPFSTDHSPSWWSWSVIFWLYSPIMSFELCPDPMLGCTRRPEPVSFRTSVVLDHPFEDCGYSNWPTVCTPPCSAFVRKMCIPSLSVGVVPSEVGGLANVTRPFSSAQLGPRPSVFPRLITKTLGGLRFAVSRDITPVPFLGSSPLPFTNFLPITHPHGHVTTRYMQTPIPRAGTGSQ